MYDYSGDFSYNIGIPTKAAIPGALMIIIPGVAGIVSYSPRLND
jgi:glutaminase